MADDEKRYRQSMIKLPKRTILTHISLVSGVILFADMNFIVSGVILFADMNFIEKMQ